MIETLQEFENLIAAVARPERISMISEPDGPAGSLQVRLDHGDTEPGPEEGMGDNAEVFPMFAVFSIAVQSWADALRAAQDVKQAIISQKRSRWYAGPITREDSEGIYSIRLRVNATRSYNP